jgi:hypothetical protein
MSIPAPTVLNVDDNEMPMQKDSGGSSNSNPESIAAPARDPISCRILIIDDNHVGARAM